MCDGLPWLQRFITAERRVGASFPLQGLIFFRNYKTGKLALFREIGATICGGLRPPDPRTGGARAPPDPPLTNWPAALSHGRAESQIFKFMDF